TSRSGVLDCAAPERGGGEVAVRIVREGDAVRNHSRGVAQSGSAFGSGPKGRWVKSSRPDNCKSAPILSKGSAPERRAACVCALRLEIAGGEMAVELGRGARILMAHDPLDRREARAAHQEEGRRGVGWNGSALRRPLPSETGATGATGAGRQNGRDSLSFFLGS